MQEQVSASIEPYKVGQFDVDPTKRLVRLPDRSVYLRNQDFNIFQALLLSSENTLGKEDLSALLWEGPITIKRERHLRAIVNHLRASFGNLEVISWEKKAGYRLNTSYGL
ncbi:MAG TPA: hypothetical protein VLE91_02985 [Candidatus Saccharimonadales bacterium]|nr:hypothetical protein [Candidatus Saccharimonadales bacterium]